MERKLNHLVNFCYFIVFNLLPFLFFPTNIFAIDVSDLQYGSLIGRDISFFEDRDSKYTIADIRANHPNVHFVPSKQETLNFGHTSFSHWLKLDLRNDSPNSTTSILEIDYNNIDEVDFYHPISGETKNEYEMFRSGMSYPFHVRKSIHRNFIYKITLQPSEVKTIYLRIRTMGGLILPIHLWNQDDFYLHDSKQMQGLGFYFGIMFVMLIYNLFIFISVKDVSYLYYIGYIFGLSGIQLVLTGLGFQYFWSESPWWQQNLYVIFSSICMSMSLLFAKSFLNISGLSQKLNLILKMGAALNFLLLPLIFILPRNVNIIVAIVLSVPSIMLAIYAGVFSYLRQYRPARYYLLAFTMLILSGLFVIMKFLNLIESNFFTDYGLYVGSCLEVVLLSFALASRINTIKREKEEAQAKTLEMQKILTESYARFVPRDFLSNLGKESILDVKLGDQIQKEMSVLFSDIRAFTTLSEKMTPAENFNFINSYLSRMSPIIQRNRGFIDKFIGDAVMALFDKSVIDAVRSGIEMQLYLKEYNSYRNNRGYDPIEIGIGIHTGSLMLGTIGAEERLEGTVISDTVNLASRIENLTKIYGSKIAVSEETVAEVKREGSYSFRFLDRVKVKGKMKAVSIYEILDGDEQESKSAKLETKEIYDKAVKLFHEKMYRESKAYFDQVLKINPKDKVTALYLKRLYALANQVTMRSVSGYTNS